MGNQAIAERISKAKEVDLVSKFNLEELIDDALLESLAEAFNKQSGIPINQGGDQAPHKKDFLEFNEQKNEDLEELIKERVITEINEDITTGFSTPDFFLEELKDPRFEKYFQVKERGEGDEYFKKQYKKFYILYIYYKIKVQDLELTKKDFYESFESFFENKSTSLEFANFDLSTRSTLTIMRDLGKDNIKLLETILRSFYQSFLSTTDELRRNVGNIDFYAEEELLDELRDFLTDHLLNNESAIIRELSLKLIILIGNQRGSGEDYLIAYNLITKHGYDFNLDPELSQSKFIESKGQGAKGEEDLLKVSYEGSSLGHILKGEHSSESMFEKDPNDPNAPSIKVKWHEIDFDKPLTLTVDSDFVYVYQPEEGLFKYGHSDSVDTKIGYLYKKNKKMDGKHKYFMYLNGNLYCRTKNSDGKPFMLINRETLKEIKNDDEFNAKIESLQKKETKKEDSKSKEEEEEEEKEITPTLGWTTEEKSDEEKKAGRYLCESPLFTDGQNIYVISTLREIKELNKEEEELEDDRKDLVIKKWILEVYDGETWEHKSSTELKLDIKVRGLDDVVSEAEEKETDNIKQVREAFSMENITNCSFVSNGKKLLVGENRRWHIYDLEELKWTFNLGLTFNHWGFDPVTNTFWEVTMTQTLRSFKIPDFKINENTDESSFKGIIEYINQKADEIQENQTLKDKFGKSTSKSIANRLRMKAKVQDKGVNFGATTNPDFTRFLLMNVLKEGSKNLITIAEDINPQAAVGEDKFSIYRGSYSTTVSSTFFSELLQAIEHTLPVLVKKEKESSNLLEQYNLYMLFILLKTSMMCLSKLNLSLSTVVAEKSDYDRYLKIIQDHISDIVSREKLEYTYEQGKYNAELETLWTAIQNECRAIMAFSLSLVYESLGDLMKKVSTSLDKLEQGEVDNSLGIYIRYLTLPETMNKALNDVEIKDMILVVYEKLCDKKTRKLISAIESVEYETHEFKRLTYNSLEKNSEGFIYSVTQNIINKYFQANKELEAETEKEKPDRDKVEKLARKVELKAEDLIKVLEIISESTLNIIKVCTTASQIYLDQAVKQILRDDEIKDEALRPKKSGKDKYVEFHRYLYNIAKENNNFTNLMHVYVAAFSSLKDSAHVKTLSLLSVKILGVIETFSKFKDVKHDDLKLKDSEDLLRSYLDNDVIKFFVWTISKMSYSFISVQKEIDLSEEEKMNKAILDSKLLSGGMENRFLGTLTKDTSSQLRDMCEVTGDKIIKGYLTKEPERLDDDDLYLSIIHHGKDENVDRLIDLLQFNLERKHIWAKSGKEEGMRLSRAAFACMMKISQLSGDFYMAMDEIEMKQDTVNVIDESVVRKELAKELAELDSYKEIFKRYESAAKMRSWYQEKKKSWAEKIRKEEEEKKRKEEEEKQKKEKENKKGKEETKTQVEEEEEEVIETTTDQDSKKKTKDIIELAKIVEKVVEKAEFLLKLEIPHEWGGDEDSLVQSMSEREERDKEEQDIEDKGDWLTKLKTWKNRQSENLNDEKNSAVVSSSTASILGCLQAPITAQRIKKQIESIYVNAMKRICGFRLIARLSYVNHPIDTCIEYLNWFCSSLRHNTNVLAHYTDGVSGCGEHLQNELKKSFFLVFNGIVKQLKKTKNKEDIKFLLNCCKWQFTASDHDSIIRSEIFEVLSEGNGKKDEKANPIKYCWGHKFRYNETSNYPLCQDVLDLFEQVLVACFARIIKGDSGEEQSLKSSGTSVPKIERAHSKLNTTTTESLIANGFKHVFEQLQNYIEFTQEFEGIDWEFYVSKRNNQRLKGEKIEESDSEEEEELKAALDHNAEGFIGPAPPPGMFPDGGSLFGPPTGPSRGGLFTASRASSSLFGVGGGGGGGLFGSTALTVAEESSAPAEEAKVFVGSSTRRDYDEGEGEGDDNEDEIIEEEEEDIKDKVQQKVEDKENREIKKIKELYEDKYIIRFLKLIEIFSSIASNEKRILGMVLKVATPQELTILINLLVHSAPRHGLTIVKILDNLIRVGIPHELFDESIKRLSTDPESVHSRIINEITPINKFEKTPFLKFLYNYVISIRSSMWTDSSFDSNGSFILSNKLICIFRTILNNDIYKFYKEQIITAIDHLIANSDDYDLEELEPLLSILNGGEYLGLGLGTSGVSSDGSMFTVLGFVKKWYGIKNPGEENNNPNNNMNVNNDDLDQKHKLNYYLQDKTDYVLALYYDPKHPERTDIFTTIPEEVKLIPNLIKENNDILLDKQRLNLFLKNFKLDQDLDKRDYKSTTIRTLALKILEQYISDHGEELIKLIDEEFYKSFLKLLYSEACAPSTDRTAQQNDWIEQKVHALQEYAVENKGSLRTSSDTKVRFTNKNLVLTKTLKSAGNQKYSKCIDLISAMNYGRVILGENYLVHKAAKLPKEDKHLDKVPVEDLRLIDSDELTNANELYRHLKTTKIILSCDVNIEDMHSELLEKDSDLAYFRSVVLIGKSDYDNLKDFLNQDPEINVVNTSGLSSEEKFIKEMTLYGGFEEKTLREILKDNPDATLSQRTNLVADWFKTQEEKKDSKEEEKKENFDEYSEITATKEELEEDILSEDEWEIIDTSAKRRKSIAIRNKLDEELNKPEYDEETIFGLEKNDKYTQIFTQVATYGNVNYQDNQNKPKKPRGILSEKVYGIKPNNLEGDYLNAVSNFFTSMCRKTIMSLFKISNVDNLLNRLFYSSKDTQNFVKYVKIIGNELVLSKLNLIDEKSYDEFKTILNNILSSCYKNKEFTQFLHNLLEKVLVKEAIKGLKTALEGGAKEIKTYFDNETTAVKTINFYILTDIIGLYIKECPEFIFEKEHLFKKLITALFLIATIFRSDQILQKKVYLTILKIVVMVEQNVDDYTPKIRQDLLSLKIFKDLIECINYTKDSSNSYNFKLTDEHKLLFEIFLKFASLHKSSSKDGIEPIYTYNQPLLTVERCRNILKERKKFDMISYLMYLNNLDDASKQSTIMHETIHNHFAPKVSANIKHEGFKKMALKVQTGSELELFSSVAVTSDKEGNNILKNIFQKDVNDNKTEVTIFNNSCYLHYPYRSPKIIAFGDKDQNRLGTDSGTESTKEPEVVPEMFKNITSVSSNSTFISAIDESGDYYQAGTHLYFNTGYPQKFTKAAIPGFKPQEDKLVKVQTGPENVVLLTESGKIYIEGRNEGYQIDDTGDKYTFVEKKTPDEKEDPVVDMAAGKQHHFIITKSGKLYGAGNYFLKEIGLECGKKYAKIELAGGAKALKVFTTSNDKPNVAYVLVESKGRHELWSAGESNKGLLGKGEDTKKSNTFSKVDYEADFIKFTQIFSKYDHTLAITEDGQLYGWGCNVQHRLGLESEGDKYVPTHIEYFKDYFVHSAAVGLSHSLVIASPKNNKDKKMIFSLGREEGVYSHFGITEEEFEEEGHFITHLKKFDHLNPYIVEAGNKTSFVIVEGDKLPSSDVGVHQGIKCEATGESPVVGILHFFDDKNGKRHYFSQKGYEKAQDKIPAITFATKYPIKDIEEVKLPSLKESELLEDKNTALDFRYPSYRTNLKVGEKPISKVELTEKEFKNTNQYDLDPLIFYRINKPLNDGKDLPVLDMLDFFEQTEKSGLNIELSPDFSYEKNQSIIDKSKDSYKDIYDQVVRFPKQCDRELLETLEKYIAAKDLNFEDTNSKIEIFPSDLTFKTKKIKNLPEKTKQQRINALIEFNKQFLTTIPYVLLDEETLTDIATGNNKLTDKLSEMFILGKGLAFFSIKNKYIKNIVQNLQIDYDCPEVRIKRRRAQVFKDSGKVDHKGEYTIFGQIWRKMKEKNFISMKKNEPEAKAWSATLLGEGSIDVGGPYRESITNMCEELMSDVLPLLMRTPNNKNDHGLGRDCYMINPTSISPTYLEMYEFLGALMGMAFRAGQILDLKLSPSFYKSLAGEPLNLNDLKAFDLYAVQAINELKKTKRTVDREMFNEYAAQTWSTTLSNGEEIELKPEGKMRVVQYDEIDEYISATLEARFKEGEKQMQAIRKGFEVIFPTTIMGILTWKEVEYRIIGPTDIDIDHLKKMTRYAACSEKDEFVQRFWRTFDSFTQEERSMYLKFVWGRSRLPPPDTKGVQNHTISLMNERYNRGDQDKMLPKANTCFFQLDLPRYTKDSICREKMLYAIEACGEIDTDAGAGTVLNDDDRV